MAHEKSNIFKMKLNHRTIYFYSKEAVVSFKENIAAASVEEITWEQYDRETNKINAQTQT
jgi:hypothetical protein